MTTKAAKVISRLYEAFINDPQLLPPKNAHGGAYGLAEESHHGHHENTTQRIVADYIAGMTDRFAIKEYARIFDPRELT